MAVDSQWTIYGRMAKDYKSDRLINLCEHGEGVQTGPFGSQLHQKDYVQNGTPIITVEHLGENRITHCDIPCVSESDFQRLSKYSIRKGDIVFSRVGSVDRRALVREEDGRMLSLVVVCESGPTSLGLILAIYLTFLAFPHSKVTLGE